MELQQLRYVLAVAEERNFTRAAAKTHVVQSALSHQIKALERELGVQLFARTSRRVELTEAGHAFVAGARATLDAADRTVTEAVAATGQMRGSLTVGAIPTVTRLDLTGVLGRFRRTYPHVSIGMSVGGSLDFIDRIRAGSLDAAVLGLPEDVEPKGVANTVIAEERLVAVLGPGHRFAGRRRLRLADLADEAFVDFPADSPGRAQSDRAFAEAGLTRSVAFEVDARGHDARPCRAGALYCAARPGGCAGRARAGHCARDRRTEARGIPRLERIQSEPCGVGLR
jgi:DNA-binding transcriptional LysR family regulator